MGGEARGLGESSKSRVRGSSWVGSGFELVSELEFVERGVVEAMTGAAVGACRGRAGAGFREELAPKTLGKR